MRKEIIQIDKWNAPKNCWESFLSTEAELKHWWIDLTKGEKKAAVIKILAKNKAENGVYQGFTTYKNDLLEDEIVFNSEPILFLKREEG